MRRRKFLFERALWRKPLEKIRAEILMEELPRTLELWDLIMIGIGGTVGTGVFATAGMVTKPFNFRNRKKSYSFLDRLSIVMLVQQLF